jgi:hypothetical protein
LFDNLSILHHPDGVPVGKSSSWWVTISVVCCVRLRQRLHDALFAMGVKAGGGFIQQQQAARHQQRAGDGDTLRLPDRQTAA